MKVLHRRRAKKQQGSNKAYKTNILIAKKHKKIKNKRNDALRKVCKKISINSDLAVLENQIPVTGFENQEYDQIS